ncbi:MAG TPA: hypothetical protein DDY91_01880 [Planctomycetaceae bacterium]|nr:hypothetical protein [Planctomycetaceae bacterium]
MADFPQGSSSDVGIWFARQIPNQICDHDGGSAGVDGLRARHNWGERLRDGRGPRLRTIRNLF